MRATTSSKLVSFRHSSTLKRRCSSQPPNFRPHLPEQKDLFEDFDPLPGKNDEAPT
jgi:hypothetical protein